MADGDGQIGLAQMQGLGDQRESEVRDDGAGADEVGEEAIQRRLLINDVALASFTSEAVGDEIGANRTQQFGQSGGGGGYVNKDVIPLGRLRGKNFLAKQRRKQERVAFFNWRVEKGNHEVGVTARGHEARD